MWQLMLCLLTANIVPAMITALIQNIQELMVPVSGLELGKKEYVSATGLGETKRSLGIEVSRPPTTLTSLSMYVNDVIVFG